MKDFITAVILAVVLITLFSYTEYNLPTKITENGYAKYKGDSGLIIPGKGEELANTNIEPELPREQAEEETAVETEATEETEITSEKNHTEVKGEHKNMNSMIIAFWHGVAAVLIGEVSALLVAFAWMKANKHIERLKNNEAN